MMKDQKGITLVALIITIIVMLILVAVTISIALNGGIFDKARQASKDTLQAQLNEAVALAKADVLMEYYANGANGTTVENNALAKFNPAAYLDPEAWKVKGTITPAFDTQFTVTFTNNNNDYSVPVTINRSVSSPS